MLLLVEKKIIIFIIDRSVFKLNLYIIQLSISKRVSYHVPKYVVDLILIP